MMAVMDDGIRDIKIEHLKGKGDQALQEGNNKTAYTRYTEALDLKPGRDAAKRLLSNRSLAYTRALRFVDALEDAERVLTLAPAWQKAHYRKGSALMGLKQYPEAALAFRNAWQLDSGNTETSNKLQLAVYAMTREQLAAALLQTLDNLQTREDILPAARKAATPQELQESLFCIIKAACKELPRAKPYQDQYIRWLRSGANAGEAYSQRSAIYETAKCFLQAREDALQAVAWYEGREKSSRSSEDEEYRFGLAVSYLRLGRAYLADAQHADRDCCEAAKAFARGLALDAANVDLQEGAKSARQSLTLEQLHEVQQELCSESCDSLGNAEGAGKELTLTLLFPLAVAKHFDAAARKALCKAVQAGFGTSPRQVFVDRVKKAEPGLEIGLTIAGGNLQQAKQSLSTTQALTSIGQELQDLLGPCKLLSSNIDELLHPTGPATQSMMDTGRRKGTSEYASVVSPSNSKELMQVPQSKLEIALPYKAYKLVTAEGGAVERLDKHPFCMSRVFYNKAERPAEVWAEDVNGSYRWRQTGSEVKVIALKVPSHLSSKQLAVTLEPFRFRVTSRDGSEVFLEGNLERGIIPRESVWMHGGEQGEDGFLLLLQKMNLELLQRHWLHSEMWWPRLFADGPEIAWDDYEKDYSDLPAPVLAAHAAVEEAKESCRQLEAAEKCGRDKRQDRNDARRRQRLMRLRAMRPTSVTAWSHLQLALAACS